MSFLVQDEAADTCDAAQAAVRSIIASLKAGASGSEGQGESAAVNAWLDRLATLDRHVGVRA